MVNRRCASSGVAASLAGARRQRTIWRHRPCGLDECGSSYRPRITPRRRRGRVLDGVRSELNELLGAFELAIFLIEPFVFRANRAGPERGQSLGNRRSEATTDARAN